MNANRVRRALACCAVAWCSAVVAHAQRGTGELRMLVRDATNAAVQAFATVQSGATEVRRSIATDANGVLVVHNLPFGPYRVAVNSVGFAEAIVRVDIRSELPQTQTIVLAVAPITAAVSVSNVPDTLVDPFRPAAAQFLGADLLSDRPSSMPGRSIIDLVNTQPGWLLEANGILHPRASEYQVQYVVDGIPLKDNRSPAFAQSVGVDQFQSLTVRTAGFPAEYGGKLGGVIEVSSIQNAQKGFHGAANLQAGSVATLSGDVGAHYTARHTSVGVSAERMRTDRYLDPPVEENFTNHGAGGAIGASVQHQWTDNDRTRASVGRYRTDFDVPNETLQQDAGQRQERSAGETLAQITHDRILSPNVLASVRFMARDTNASLTANALSTPILPSQQRGFREEYLNGSIAVHDGRHEMKFGAEATFASIHELFSSQITAYRVSGVRVFDRDLPASFSFEAQRPDREQALYAQDLVRFGPATLSAGVRYDHYRLMVDEDAFSPRLAASWFHAASNAVFHVSYDRVFQTPAVENVLLASSDLVGALGGQGQSLSLRPSRGNYYEVGVSKAFVERWRLDVNYFYRRTTNTADDDLLLNTAVSFPIAFAEGTVKGVEAKLEVPGWNRWSGWISYSNALAVGRLPIAGGLFLDDGAAQLLASTGTFPISQDQRNTGRWRARYQLHPRAWIATGGHYNSGLPVEVATASSILLQQYGAAVLDRVDFDRGRVRPSISIDLAASVDLLADPRRQVKLQVDLFNLADRLNVTNFAGLFSGTAIAPRRSGALRVRVVF